MSTKDLNALLRVFEDVFVKTENWRALTDDELKTNHRKFYEITNNWSKYASKQGEVRIKKLKEAIKAARIARIRERIFEQANNELIEIETEKFGKFTTTRAPFLRWCLRYMNTEGMTGKKNPDWAPVAGTGWKTHMDDPFHTDWWMALTPQVDLKEAYNHDYDNSVGGQISIAAHEMKSDIVREYTSHQFVTLCRGNRRKGRIYGRVEFPEPNEDVQPGSIAVVPHAGPEYQIAMETANKPDQHGDRGCVIANTGGKLAHLAVVGREMGATVLMIPNATEIYKFVYKLIVDLEKGTIEVMS
jgi:hypothetical protein